MSCEHCEIASKRLWSQFTVGCKGCLARSCARSPHYRRVRDAGVLDRQYRMLLEQFKVTHDEVKAAAQRDFEQRGADKVPANCR